MIDEGQVIASLPPPLGEGAGGRVSPFYRGRAALEGVRKEEPTQGGWQRWGGGQGGRG